MPKQYIYGIVLILMLSCTKKKIEIDILNINSSVTCRLNKIKFLTPKIGFITGGVQFTKPALLKTIDGGNQWEEISLPSNTEQKEIYNLDILPNGHLMTVGYGGTIFISKDTGNSFQYIQEDTWSVLKDIAFKNPEHAIIIGGSGFSKGSICHLMMDAGSAAQNNELKNFEISDIDIVDSQTAYISGYGAILKSTDGCKTWTFTAAKNDYFKAMVWKNNLEGIAVGYEGSIQKTTDGGGSWRVIRNGNDITKTKYHFLDVARNIDNKIIAVGENGATLMSKDDGDHWGETTKFFYSDLRGVEFSDDNTCFIVGDKGRVFQITFPY